LKSELKDETNGNRHAVRWRTTCISLFGARATAAPPFGGQRVAESGHLLFLG
jgi:hypothetical protein